MRFILYVDKLWRCGVEESGQDPRRSLCGFEGECSDVGSRAGMSLGITTGSKLENNWEWDFGYEFLKGSQIDIF